MDGARSVAGSLSEELERAFDAIPDLMAILDLEHRIVRVNRAMAERLGCDRDDLPGKLCYKVIHGTDSPPGYCPHLAMLRDGREHTSEIEDDRLGGTFLVSVSPLTDGEGRIVGCVHMARDITNQKRAEADARKAASQRETFLAMLSHELRNPLGAILNAAYIVKRAPAKHGSFREALAVIERQASQMSFLLEDLLDVSRAMQGKIQIRREVVDLCEILRNAVKLIRPKCEERGQTLEVHLGQDRMMVKGDPSRLQQVQVNLLTNASKYTPPGGRIGVSAHLEQDEFVLRVWDNGRGIPPDQLESVFDLFEQVDGSRDRQDGGMGVGLTLVRMLVALHGGTVSARSEGQGKGSEFIVRLPQFTAEAAARTLRRDDSHNASHARILIVEDNADSRTMLQALLQLDGHHVRVAEDGIAGLETLKTNDFDVAIIDIGLPGLDGYEIARRFRSLHREHEPRLIALTGYGLPSDRQAVFDAGFDEHIVKPCAPQDIERILQRTR